MAAIPLDFGLAVPSEFLSFSVATEDTSHYPPLAEEAGNTDNGFASGHAAYPVWFGTARPAVCATDRALNY